MEIPKPKKRKKGRAFQTEFTKVKPQVAERDEYRCQLCKLEGRWTKATQVHHIKYRSQGGTNDPSNLVCLCYECHEKAHGLNGGNAKEIADILKNRR